MHDLISFFTPPSGAPHLHLVDLEGAKDGSTPNLDVIAEIASGTDLFIEVGGGVRNMETAEKYLKKGVSRVILGTAAVNDKAFLKAAVSEYGEKIAVGADVLDGKIAVRGWLETADVTLGDFLSEMQSIGVKNVICTDISRDGAMRGANIALYGKLSKEYNMEITASGGVSSIDDVVKLKNFGLYGAIIGKALYTGDIDLKEALKAAL